MRHPCWVEKSTCSHCHGGLENLLFQNHSINYWISTADQVGLWIRSNKVGSVGIRFGYKVESDWIRLDQYEPGWIRMDQDESVWVSLVQLGSVCISSLDKVGS